MPEVRAHGLKISYETTGEGDPLLFLPGTATDSSAYLPAFSQHLSDHLCILIDPRDTPKSDPALEPYSPRDLAKEALAVMEGLGMERADVAGYSLGGAAALELATIAPGRVTNLILIAAWARTDPLLSHIFDTLISLAQDASTERVDEAMLWLTFGPQMHEPDSYEGLRVLMNSRGQSTAALQRQLMCAKRHRCVDVEVVNAPTLVISAGRDAWIRPHHQAMLVEEIPDATLELFDDAYHGLIIERSAEVCDSIRRFLARSA